MDSMSLVSGTAAPSACHELVSNAVFGCCFMPPEVGVGECSWY